MKNIWILVECLSGSTYAFSTREKAENAMIELIERIRYEDNLFLGRDNDARTFCEENNWNCFDMYLMDAEWQG